MPSSNANMVRAKELPLGRLVVRREPRATRPGWEDFQKPTGYTVLKTRSSRGRREQKQAAAIKKWLRLSGRGRCTSPHKYTRRLTNAAGNMPKTSTVLLDNDKSCGAKIHNKTIPRANDNSHGAVAPDDNGEQPPATDDDNDDNNDDKDGDKDGSKKAAPLPKVVICCSRMRKRFCV